MRASNKFFKKTLLAGGLMPVCVAASSLCHLWMHLQVSLCVCAATLLWSLVKRHVWFQTSGPNGDKDKKCVKLYTHTTCHFCPQAFISHFSSFRLSKQLILKKSIPALMSGYTWTFLDSRMTLWRQFWLFWMHFISEGSLFQSTCLDLRAVWRQM